MLKLGLILIGCALVSLVLLAALSGFGLARFGPCGPDGVGLVFFLGMLGFGALGLLFTLAGIIQRFVRRCRVAQS
jgi:hypothetical protein